MASWRTTSEVSKFFVIRKHKELTPGRKEAFWRMATMKSGSANNFLKWSATKYPLRVSFKIEMFFVLRKKGSNDGSKSCLSVWWWQHRNGKWCHKTKTSPL